MTNIKAVVTDSDVTLLNSWAQITKTYLRLANKYSIDTGAMNRKYGLFDACGAGPLEFMDKTHREDFYAEYINEVTRALANSRKLINPKDLRALERLKERGISLYIISGNYEEIVRGATERIGHLVTGIYGYRREDYYSDLQRGFTKPTRKRETLKRLLTETGLKRNEIVLIDDGPKMIEESADIPERYLIYSVGIPGTNIRIPFPKFANGGSKHAWSFASVVENI